MAWVPMASCGNVCVDILLKSRGVVEFLQCANTQLHAYELRVSQPELGLVVPKLAFT